MDCDACFYFSFNFRGGRIRGEYLNKQLLMESSEKSWPSQWRSLLCASSRLRGGGVEYLDRRDVVNRTRPWINPLFRSHCPFQVKPSYTENFSISQLRIVRCTITRYAKWPSDGITCTVSGIGSWIERPLNNPGSCRLAQVYSPAIARWCTRRHWVTISKL